MAKKKEESKAKEDLKVVNGLVKIESNGKSKHMEKGSVYNVTVEMANILIEKGVAIAK